MNALFVHVCVEGRYSLTPVLSPSPSSNIVSSFRPSAPTDESVAFAPKSTMRSVIDS